MNVGGNAATGGTAGDTANPSGGGGGGDGCLGASNGTAASADPQASEARPDAVSFLPGVTVATLAGSATAGHDDGPRATATFANPVSVLMDATGGLLICDFDNNKVRRLDFTTGEVSTLISQSGFFHPFGLALALDGSVYVDTDYNQAGVKSNTSGTIWHFDPATGSTTVVAAELGRPRGLAMMDDGQLALSDYQNARVRLLDVASQSVRDLAGSAACPGMANGHGPDARFSVPYGVVTLPNGDLVVADYGNHALRRVTPAGDVSLYAGDGTSGTIDGPLASAPFAGPVALALDFAGNIYVSDRDAHRIRRVGADQTVTTVAGNGVRGFQDGTGDAAEFYGQEGIAVSPDGHSLYLADGTSGEETAAYHRIRVLTLP